MRHAKITIDLGAGEKEYTLVNNIRAQGAMVDHVLDFFPSTDSFDAYMVAAAIRANAADGADDLPVISMADSVSFIALQLWSQLQARYPEITPEAMQENLSLRKITEYMATLRESSELVAPDPEHLGPVSADKASPKSPTAPGARRTSKRSGSSSRVSGSRSRKRKV